MRIWQRGSEITTMGLFYKECMGTDYRQVLGINGWIFFWKKLYPGTKPKQMAYQHIMSRLRKNTLRCYNHQIMMARKLRNDSMHRKKPHYKTAVKRGRRYQQWWSRVICSTETLIPDLKGYELIQWLWINRFVRRIHHMCHEICHHPSPPPKSGYSSSITCGFSSQCSRNSETVSLPSICLHG